MNTAYTLVGTKKLVRPIRLCLYILRNLDPIPSICNRHVNLKDNLYGAMISSKLAWSTFLSHY